MKIISLLQGSPEWHAHRTMHFNASEAPVMLGHFPTISRPDLLHVRATGIESDVSAFLQKIFDEGHRFEALARPLAEQIIGEELYPCVGVNGRYSASFDGLTLMGDVGFEHKSLNNDLREIMVPGCTGSDLPIFYQEQMEQQAKVSGEIERILFMASEWDDAGNLIEERHCWYTPSPELRARIVAGWEQFERDLANYEPPKDVALAPIGRAPDQLPALRIELTGVVTASNLAEFRNHAIAVFRGINTDLQTDQDFADAERTVKWCGDIEDRLKAAKEHALSQTESIDRLFKAIDDISAEARTKRLELDKLVKVRKESIRGEIVTIGINAVREHYAEINASMAAHAIAVPASLASEIGAVIKGKKSVASMRDAVNAAVANAKIDASQRADRVRANMLVLADYVTHSHLFADSVSLCATKAPDDLRLLAEARIADHLKREADRLERERERIRQEESARIEHERAAAERESQAVLDRATVAEATMHEVPKIAEVALPVRAAIVPSTDHPVAKALTSTMTVGDINSRIAPITIGSSGLASLGFQPCAKDRNAMLYDAADFGGICAAIVNVVEQAARQKVAA